MSGASNPHICMLHSPRQYLLALSAVKYDIVSVIQLHISIGVVSSRMEASIGAFTCFLRYLFSVIAMIF